jgi:hypothetical protein
MQGPVNIKVPHAQRPSVFPLFDLFAPISWPLVFKTRIEILLTLGLRRLCARLRESRSAHNLIKSNTPR